MSEADDEKRTSDDRRPPRKDSGKRPFTPRRDSASRSDRTGQRPERSGPRPDRDGQRPARDGQRPARDGQRPARDGQRPARDGQRPAGDGQRPARDGQRPARDGQRPARDGQRPDRGGQRPDRGGRPSNGGPGERRLWTKDGKPARNDSSASRFERPPLTEEELRARELRAVRPRHDDPIIPDDVTPRDLDKVARMELKTLNKENAEEVARHLAMAARLIEEDPALAHLHATSAARRAGRIGVVRETLAITAYATGDFALALRELRTYRRISGSNEQLALMIDSERGIGRPDRALEVGRSVERSSLSVASQVAVAIAMSGARLDLGQPDAALTELEIPQLNPDVAYSYSPDLFDAYAEVLTELGQDEEAARWRERAERADAALNGDGDDTIEVFEELDDEDDGDDIVVDDFADDEGAEGDESVPTEEA